jgi:hypothetical protein
METPIIIPSPLPPRPPGALVWVLFKIGGAAITTISEDKIAAVSAKGPKHESSQELDELEEQGAGAPTVPSKNWAVLMYRGMIVTSIAYYIIKGRHVYTGPVMLTKRDL